jgi:GT2 family glycosyltransferase
MKLPLVSIILLNYNGKKYIQRCVESILKSDYNNFELIIVDNNSTDKSIDIVESKTNDARISIIRSNKNLGFAAGNNLGAQYAKGNYLVLLNVDTVVDARWLTELISVIEYDDTIGAAQPKILALDDKVTYDSAGDYIDYFGHSFRRGGAWDEKDQGQYDTVHDIFSARGAALVTRKEIVENIGLFDESFFMTNEDIDFCWRVRLYGKRVVFVPKSIVYHTGSGITSQETAILNNYDMHALKNHFACLFKNYDTPHMIKYAILPILIIHIVTGFFLLQPFIMNSNDKLARTKNRLQTYYWIFTNIKNLRDKRYHIQRNIRRVPDSEIMKNMVKTSIWDLVVLAINILKFGRSKASLLYFNKGIRDIPEFQITDARFR